jgi:hypothetical protein
MEPDALAHRSLSEKNGMTIAINNGVRLLTIVMNQLHRYTYAYLYIYIPLSLVDDVIYSNCSAAPSAPPLAVGASIHPGRQYTLADRSTQFVVSRPSFVVHWQNSVNAIRCRARLLGATSPTACLQPFPPAPQ